VALSRRDDALLQLLQVEAPVENLRTTPERLIFDWKGRRFHLGRPNPGPECGEPLSLDHLWLRAERHDSFESFRLPGAEPAV